MIVCHCRGVSDRAIRSAVRGGARSCQQVENTCKAGLCCGGCQPLIREIIEREAPRQLKPALLSSALAVIGLVVVG
jgi:nitrite reductase (NADH) large subunit